MRYTVVVYKLGVTKVSNLLLVTLINGLSWPGNDLRELTTEFSYALKEGASRTLR